MSWVSEVLLGSPTASVITEVPFLMSGNSDGAEASEVGRIDTVLVNDDGGHLSWCALEMQAVYFSGDAMEKDFKVHRDWQGPGIPCPAGKRHPDFRSSGPKRLMPQLQIKVPTIARWGRKMAVVVDESFWNSLGSMRSVNEISNADIAWFVVSYEPGDGGKFSLSRRNVFFTTLDHAVGGLTGGSPVPLANFEASIRSRLTDLRTRSSRAR